MGLLTLHVQACPAHKLLGKRLCAPPPTACESAQHNDLVNTRLTFTKHATRRPINEIYCGVAVSQEEHSLVVPYGSWQAQGARTAASRLPMP